MVVKIGEIPKTLKIKTLEEMAQKTSAPKLEDKSVKRDLPSKSKRKSKQKHSKLSNNSNVTKFPNKSK